MPYQMETADRFETFFELSPAVTELVKTLYAETKDDNVRLRVSPLLSAKATRVSEKMLLFILERLADLQINTPSFD